MEDSGIDSGDHNGDNTKASQNGDRFHVRQYVNVEIQLHFININFDIKCNRVVEQFIY